jgi:type IV pilus assembly protein PilC
MMARFRYSAATPEGVVVKGTESLPDIAAVYQALSDRKLQPISVTERKNPLQFEITKKKVKKRDLMHLCRQLAVFVRSGVTVMDALEVLAEESSDKVMSKALSGMMGALGAGARFSEAASLHPELFPQYAVEVLRSAELTGNLDQVLDQLGDYLEREIETSQKIKSALTYPVIVVILAIAVSTVLVTFVLPRFESFFKSLKAKLPLPTRVLLDIGAWVGKDGPYLAVALLIVAVVAFLLSRTEKGKEVLDKLVLKIPMVGNLVHIAIVERFCRLLASMVVAGVGLPEAIAVVTAATNNAVFRNRLTAARGAMMRGEGLAGPLATTGLFPGAARRMFMVGENTGNLDEQLQSAAKYLDSELNYKLKRFTDMLEPAVIIAVGFIVGFVAIALISAMYGIYRQVNIQ